METPSEAGGSMVGPKGVLLAIDLTNAVINEAIRQQVAVLVVYHPPIFSGWKKLLLAEPKQNYVMRAIAAGISIYSPHTSLDACVSGSKPASSFFSLLPFLFFFLSNASGSCLGSIFSSFLFFPFFSPSLSFCFRLVNDWLASLLVAEKERESIAPIKAAVNPPAGQEQAGSGRLVTFKQPIPFETLLGKLKQSLGLKYVRIAKVKDEIKTVAICAGSGPSLLNGVKADLYLSGEFGHHDTLQANAKGISVILLEHSNSERGYLKAILQPKLQELLGTEAKVTVSVEDKEPIAIV